MESILNWVVAQYGAFGLVFALLIFYIRELKKDIRSILSDLRDERNYSRELNTLLRNGQTRTIETLNAIERAFTSRSSQ